MRCNTVAITDPSLLPPLLSPFFFSLSPSVHLSLIFSLLFRPVFLYHLYSNSSFSPFSPRIEELSLEDRRRIVRNVKFIRYSMIQLKMEGKNSEEKILGRVNLGFRR